MAIKLSYPPSEIMMPRGCEKPIEQTGCPPGAIKGPRGCQKPSDQTGCPPGEVKVRRGCVKEVDGREGQHAAEVEHPAKTRSSAEAKPGPPKRIEQIPAKPLLVEPGKR